MSKGKLFGDMRNKQKDSLVRELKVFMEAFENKFGLDIYLQYGTLLGAVRGGDFIDHDNDIDLAYLSRYHKFQEVYREMIRIYKCFEKKNLLRDRGGGRSYHKNCGHAHILSNNKKVAFDIWTSWIDEDGKYYFWSMGMGVPRGNLIPFDIVKLRGVDFKVPHRYKKVLEYLYGRDWRREKHIKSYRYRKAHLEPLYERYAKLKNLRRQL